MLQAMVISLMILVTPSHAQIYAVDDADMILHSFTVMSADDCIKTANDLNAAALAETAQKSGEHFYICLPVMKPSTTDSPSTNGNS